MKTKKSMQLWVTKNFSEEKGPDPVRGKSATIIANKNQVFQRTILILQLLLNARNENELLWHCA